jgi:hypothetical protein
MQGLRLIVSLPVSILMDYLPSQKFLPVYYQFAACNGKGINGK